MHSADPLHKDHTPVIRVLLYHRVMASESERDIANIGVSVRAFRKQIEWLDKWGFTPITFYDYSLYLQGTLDLPKKPIIITFDDTYMDMYKNGFPILNEYGMRAVIYTVVDESVTTSTWDEGLGEVFPLVGDKELLEMHAAGFEVGSHTLTHPRLTKLDAEAARDEIEKSKADLEKIIGDPVISFSYPYGLINKQIKQLVKDAGYLFACASYTGPPIFTDDRYEIRRIKARNTTSRFVFWFQLQQVYLYYRWIRWALHRGLSSFF